MLVTLETILKIADARGIAVGSFNTPNLASLEAVIGAAEELNEPVIIMHAQVHEEMGLCKMDVVGPMMLMMAEKAKVPVCVHLDHGTDLDYLHKGLDIGFTSIMYDGSALPAPINYANTAAAVEMAARYGASVEAEIGSMGAREGGEVSDPESIYTDPDEAAKFVRETGIDALACSFGTVHGLYLKTPKLDFDRVEKIRSLVDVPLVMHGGSGVSTENYKRVIQCGIRKINYYTYMAKAGGAAVRAMGDFTYYHEAYTAALNAMKENVKSAIIDFTTK